MTSTVVDAIPLYPRRRLVGTASGGATSIRRGGRSDVASSRPYVPGDHFSAIDWKASARLSSARNGDEFIVRERLAEEMPAVVLVVDRRPEMALYPPELPWLHKPEALRTVAQLLIASAVNHRALVGYLDLATHPGESSAGTPYWRKPRSEASVWQTSLREELGTWLDDDFDAPEDGVTQALEHLAMRRASVPLGSFVFVLSDFIAPLDEQAWAETVARGWDVVPVVIQDPVWEQSFPDIDGVLVNVADARDGHVSRIRLGARDVQRRRGANEHRLAEVEAAFARLGLDAVLIGSADAGAIRNVFLGWAQSRLELSRGAR